ncbi:MAG: hypothetical protein ACOYN6_00960 [Ignavibacteria bacterium]
MIKQFIAGYILDSINEIITDKSAGIDWKDTLKYLSYFDVVIDSELEPLEIDSQITILDNILSRGTPTKATTYIENIFSEKLITHQKRKGSLKISIQTLLKKDFKELKDI